MASISIQARIDSDVWEGIRAKGETNTQLLQRIAAHYSATSAERLASIAPTPDAAVAVLLRSHSLLDQMVAGGVTTTAAAPVAQQTTAAATENKSALDCADDW